MVSIVWTNIIVFGVAILMYIRLSRVNVDLLVRVVSAREIFSQCNTIRDTRVNWH